MQLIKKNIFTLSFLLPATKSSRVYTFFLKLQDSASVETA